MMSSLAELVVLIKGGGEIASGVAHRLHRAHFRVCLTEIKNPLAVCRGNSFSEAVYDGAKTVEGVTAELSGASPEAIQGVWKRGNIAIAVDPGTSVKDMLKPDVLVDAIMAKRNTGTGIADAPLVIGLGTGFTAGQDVHVVVETLHGNNLGRVILEGQAEPDNKTPVAIGGLAGERVIWSQQAGIFTSDLKIGNSVTRHQTVGWLDSSPLEVPVSGLLRGLLRSGTRVPAGAKLVEIDPVNDESVCYTIRDKMRAIAGGVLEAIMMKYNTPA
jgi:xanthine dehydrogenase accessory factor